MTSRKRRRQPPPLALRRHADDGVDPREYFDRRNRQRGSSRGDSMLCAQVFECVAYVIENELLDPRLEGACVLGVEPAPDTRRLRVILTCPHGRDAEDVRDALDRCAGRLRKEVSAAITRRRTPQLVFAIVEDV